MTEQCRYVWAPDAKEVQLSTNGRAIALAKRNDGWWEGEQVLREGDEYTFTIDRKSGLADPRSRWQPAGARGPSRFVDHGNYRWNDRSWRPTKWSEAIVYELHIGTFTPDGTFECAIERLDHLKHLGVTHIEVMPIGQFPGDRGWGYDVVLPFAPQHSYGGPLGFKRFVDACHQHGLAVLLDVVYNHLGPSGNQLPEFGPYLSENYQTPWGPGLNFDAAGSDEVRSYVCDNALMWLEHYHCDGLRIDSVHEMVDSSAVHILEQLVTEVRDLERQLDKKLVLIAEDGKNNPKYVKPFREGGLEFDGQWSNDFALSLCAALTEERQGMLGDYDDIDILTAVESPYVYRRRFSKHRKHTFGRSPQDAPPARFISFIQNHDLLGNRKDGDRLGDRVSLSRLKAGAALSLLSHYTPMLFQGEEWNASSPFLFFADCHGDSELTEAVEKGRALAAKSLGWNVEEAPGAGDVNTYLKSQLLWEETSGAPQQELMTWYRGLIKLRRRLSEQAVTSVCDVEQSGDEGLALTVKRGPLTIVCNLGRTARPLPTIGPNDAVLMYSQAATGAIPSVDAESIAVIGPAEWLANATSQDSLVA